MSNLGDHDHVDSLVMLHPGRVCAREESCATVASDKFQKPTPAKACVSHLCCARSHDPRHLSRGPEARPAPYVGPSPSSADLPLSPDRTGPGSTRGGRGCRLPYEPGNVAGL